MTTVEQETGPDTGSGLNRRLSSGRAGTIAVLAREDADAAAAAAAQTVST